MSDGNRREKAEEVFAALCAAIEKRGWKYQKDSPRMMVFLGVRGEDLPMEIAIGVDKNKMLIRLLSALPFAMKEDRRLEGAVAVCAANSMLTNGCFDYRMETGAVVFRLNSSFRGSDVGENLFETMVMYAVAAIDQYNDRFMKLNEDRMSLSEFLETL